MTQNLKTETIDAKMPTVVIIKLFMRVVSLYQQEIAIQIFVKIQSNTCEESTTKVVLVLFWPLKFFPS